MILTRHCQVMKVAFRQYTSMYTSRRKSKDVKELRDAFIRQGIRIDTIEHNGKLTITIEFTP